MITTYMLAVPQAWARPRLLRCQPHTSAEIYTGAATFHVPVADTFLDAVARSQPRRPRTVALGLQEQLVDKVPVDPHDFVLDAVCLPDALHGRA